VTIIETEMLVIGSGAGGSVTAAMLAEAGHDVTIVEEGPNIEPGTMEPFSLEEMVAKYRHRGGSAALGNPPVAYAEGRCVGGSTEINSGLWHRLPAHFAIEWQQRFRIDEFTPEALDRYAESVEQVLSVSRLPGAPPASSAVIENGATKLGWRSAEFSRAFRYDSGQAVKQTMGRTFLPRATAAGATIVADCRVQKLLRSGDRIIGVKASRTRPEGGTEALMIMADHVFVCGGAIQSPALLQRSGIRRNIGVGLKLHPTIKIAARMPYALDHGDVPMHRVTEFSPDLAIGGSVSRRGYVALALADSGNGADDDEALADWERFGIYYTAIRSEGSGRVLAVPGIASPVVTYRLTEGDMSKLTRGLVHLGELLLAAGATELYPSVQKGEVVRSTDELVQWWSSVTRARTNLMTIHMTSSIRMGQARDLTGTDSYGAVWGLDNLRVNDASLVPDAPGINPQATIMSIAARNTAQFLAGR
jgi:choline dehydrogenase-like flavoprotein